MEADLIVTCLNKEFGSFRAVEDVSFSVAKGEFLSILGPSGCGKTTLLRMIAGFEKPSSGVLLIGGRNMRAITSDKRPVNLEVFRPSFCLVVFGQFSFITTFVTLVISARLRKFDCSLEEAALNLGASPFEVIVHVTLPYLRSSNIAAGAVSFLMSFENFNTALFFVGSRPTLPINLYLQVRDGSTPAINAVSLLLIVGTFLLALINFFYNYRKEQNCF
jgi:spermidine/putrescine transport system permease protein